MSWTARAAVACSLMWATLAWAEDVVLRPRSPTGVHVAENYSDAVIREALEHTRKDYGSYRMEWVDLVVGRQRLLLELESGALINTTVVATQPKWEERVLPIRIPVDMGLSNYRISLISASKQAVFSNLRSFEDLKALRVGAGNAWVSRRVMEADGFNVIAAESAEPLLKMLMNGRIDYFPRGLSEVFSEFDARKGDFPDLRVERDIVIDTPLPGYIFVSPAAKRLHQRLTAGLERMVKDGSLRRLVLSYHQDMIASANFCSRRVFKVPNPLLPALTPLARKELWFDPYDPKTGICKKR